MGMRNIPPAVTYPSPNEFLETVFPITAITNASQATVTCAAYPFTSGDQYITQITFKQVEGMLPINGLTCLIINVLSSTQFQIALNTTGFPAYTGGGVICIDTGQPPVERQGSQYFNTPWQNVY